MITSNLPIYEIIHQVQQTLIDHNTIIVQAPPGAGKSTVLPLELLGQSWLGDGKILMLQPRRIAARSVATRMATVLGEQVGERVGYRVRFETRVSNKTRIEVLTEGILTRMLQSDATLDGVSAVIFDEFHERSLHADLALALCRDLQSIMRPDLRIIIMSATLQGEDLSAKLGNIPVLTSTGRQFPIQYKYLGEDDKISVSQRVASTISQVLNNEEGNVLAFLPGGGEISQACQMLENAFPDVKIYPLYGDLSPRMQQEAIEPSRLRKVVIATSIAETSLTIEGIRVVVDCGLSRIPRFDARSGMTRLDTVRVSLDSANQRAGRAGRLGPGLCYRLWSQGVHHQLDESRKPEIAEADLAPLVLELAQWGCTDASSLFWLTPPPAAALAQAVDLLEQLGALHDKHITIKGKAMLQLPTHPRIAHLLLEAKERGLLPLACDVAAILEERDPLERNAGTNLATRVEALRSFRQKRSGMGDRSVLSRIETLASNWRSILKCPVDNSFPDSETIGFLVANAYPDRLARRADDNHTRYRLANGQTARIQQNDELEAHQYVAVAHIDGGGVGEGRIFMAAPVNITDFKGLTTERNIVGWDKQKQMLVNRVDTCFGKLIISSSYSSNIDKQDAVKILCEVIRKEGIRFLPIDDNFDLLLRRISSLKIWRPTEQWPDVSEEALLQNIDKWLSPFIDGVKRIDDFKGIDYSTALLQLMTWDQQQQLESLVPPKIEVPSGSEIKLEYSFDGSAPVLAVRLQELFGMLDTPSVNQGRNRVVVQLLSPGYKPVQTTQDLRSFWMNTYKEVKKELCRRYPKHSWPDDPFTAKAVRGVPRRNQN